MHIIINSAMKKNGKKEENQENKYSLLFEHLISGFYPYFKQWENYFPLSSVPFEQRICSLQFILILT